MADSIDRVFGHALNTVNRIRTGSRKPPLADRLALYGLYKQAMEGDVAAVQSRPGRSPRSGDGNINGPPESGRPVDGLKRDQEKWDAWHANAGMGRTEAKRRYIETLIRTMREYASDTADARALVSELEFIWTQVRDSAGLDGSDTAAGNETGRGLSVLGPESERDLDLKDGMDHDEDFHDAPVSQFDEAEGTDLVTPSRSLRRSGSEGRWRKRVEGQLVKLNTEVAALREQLESKSYIASRSGGWSSGFFGFVARMGWLLAKVLIVDSVLVLAFLLYLRRRSRERLKDAVRVMLGDAQAVALNIAGKMQQVGSKLAHR